MSARAAALAAVLALVACDRAAEADDPVDGVADGSAAPLFADVMAPTLEELRAAHDVFGEGVDCRIDSDCDSPLRCMDDVCSWPPAMTGVEDSATPFVIVRGEQGEARYYLELAVDGRAQQRGLMHRNVLVPDWGMLFVFRDERPRSFWMRNTLISLDMVFITADGHVDSVQENTTPLTDTSRPSDGPARYVLELNAGEVARLGLAPGARLEFVNLPAAYEPAAR